MGEVKKAVLNIDGKNIILKEKSIKDFEVCPVCKNFARKCTFLRQSESFKVTRENRDQPISNICNYGNEKIEDEIQAINRAIEFFSAVTYEEKLDVWIQHFGNIKEGEFWWTLPDILDSSSSKLKLSIQPNDKGEKEILGNRLNDTDLEYRIRKNLLDIFIPETGEEIEIYNRILINCANCYIKDIAKGKVIDFTFPVEPKFVRLLKSYEELKLDLENRYIGSQIEMPEFIRNEINFIKDEIEEFDTELSKILKTLDPYQVPPKKSIKEIMDKESQRLKTERSFLTNSQSFAHLYGDRKSGKGFLVHLGKFSRYLLGYYYARIIYELENNILIPDPSPPRCIIERKKEDFLIIELKFYPEYIDKLGKWTPNKKSKCAQWVVALYNNDFIKGFKGEDIYVPNNVRKEFALRYFNDSNALDDHLKKSKHPRYDKKSVKGWEFYITLKSEGFFKDNTFKSNSY